MSWAMSWGIENELNTLFADLAKGDTARGGGVIAVMPFKTGQGMAPDEGRVVAEYGVVMLSAGARYKVVDRADLSRIVAELKLAQSGLMDEENGVKVGRMLSADRLVTGSVTDAFGRRMITASIVRTETGQVLSSAAVTVQAADLTDFTRELLGEKGQVSATVFRSAVVPGWGQFYTNHPARGAASFVLFTGAVGVTVYAAVKAGDAKTEKDEYTAFLSSSKREREMAYRSAQGEDWNDLVNEYNGRLDSLYNEYDKAFGNALFWGLVTGGVWALNLADAALAGMQSRKKFNLYFSACPDGRADIRLVRTF